MLGPVTKGLNLPPVSGSRYPGPISSEATPFDPLTDIPNLARLMLYRHPYPQKTEVYNGSDPAAIDDDVLVCTDRQYIFGVTVGQLYDQCNVGGAYPTMKAQGITFTPDGLHVINAYNNVCQGGLNDWTGYFWGTYAGAMWVPYGNNDMPAAVFIDDSGLFDVYDDAASDVGGVSGASTGLVLCRFNYNATTGEFSIAATGAGFNTSSAFPGKVHSFDTVGQALGLDSSVTNGSIDNRYRGELVVARNILLGSAEDLNIRGYIAADPTGPYVL